VSRRTLALRFGHMIGAMVTMAADIELAPTLFKRDGQAINVGELFSEFIHSQCAMFRAPPRDVAALSDETASTASH